MNKYVILSVNDNPDYLFHVPLVCWAWRRLGWEPVVFYRGEPAGIVNVVSAFYFNGRKMSHNIIFLRKINGFEDETIVQCSRLYGACVLDGYLMTSDIDMLPLSDYWKPDTDKLTVWGRDLTDYHYPICYIGMDSEKWKEVMHIDGDDYQYYMQRDLMEMPQAKSADKVKRWVTDQDLITERINNSAFVPTRIDRGTDKRTGYPIGRIDRSNWTLRHKQYIDCHMFHGVHRDEMKFKKTLEMLHHVFPNDDFKWFILYYKEFKKLCQIK